MLFLIEYDRTEGRLVEIRRFDEGERFIAEEARLALELALNVSKSEHEIVLLEAESEEALHRTHRRYFVDLATLANSMSPTGGS